ncbi:MAG: Fe-S cluster assembly protein SufD [Planctomycetes bacterium]|nr:Fe-S cluster assembly protein SufD [Planctomycetota bacterium]
MSTATVAARSAFDAAALDTILSGTAGPAWASDLRRTALERLTALGLPDRRDENWMRTDLRLFKPQAWGPRPAPAPATPPPEGLLASAILSRDLAAESYADFEAGGAAVGPGRLAGRFASLDGHVVRCELDAALAARGVVFGAADELLAAHGAALRPHWFQVIDPSCDWFAAMHAAFHAASAVLYVPPGVRIADPLHVVAGISDGGVDTSHVLVVLGEGAEATVLTETAGGGSAGGPGGFHCGGTEIVVGKGAMLRMVNLQNWNTGVWHFARQKAVVHASGRLQWTLGALGSRLSQVAQDVALVGRGGSAQVNGVMFTEGRQHLVYNTLQHHEAADCRSDLLYKGALQGRSRLVWRGMIKVDKAAQKTDGYQRNDNLMLSNDARADSIPGLEIEADDVRCTHGATSGRVDAEQIFYARARGLSADEAARLVVAGFFQQVFDRITIPQVREALARAIGGRIHRIA